MRSHYHIRVEKDYLIFSAAHFITFDGNICERLHGHNWRVWAEVFGPLDQNHYVVDFILLRDELKKLVDELDHRMLLPDSHPAIKVTATDEEVEARFEDRRWIFPREDCAILPLANTTAELIANYLANRLHERLEARTGQSIARLRLAVDENNGQWAVCELSEH